MERPDLGTIDLLLTGGTLLDVASGRPTHGAYMHGRTPAEALAELTP